MTTFKINGSNQVVMIENEMETVVPEGHRFYERYLKWLDDGNVPEVVEVRSVVEEVTMRQGRLQLHRMGLLQTVNDAIAQMTGEAGERARIEWEFSSTIRRNNTTTQAILSGLNFTEAEVDTFFTEASLIAN